MPIVLFRVDERLIHGQVVIGWGHELRPERYVVVDDALSDSAWEQELYRLGAGSAEVVFLSGDVAADALPSYSGAPERTIVLTRDLSTMRTLAESGHMEGRTVNVGGLHHGQGREQVLSYVYLTPDDKQDMQAILDAGARLQARDLPDAHKVNLAEQLGMAPEPGTEGR